MVTSEKCDKCGETKITFTKEERKEQVKLTRKIVIGFKNDEAYRQLIADWLESDKPKSKVEPFTFGKIMNFLWKNLPKEEKYLYVIIRKRVSLPHLGCLLGNDWVDSTDIRMKRLIKIARKWKKKRFEYVMEQIDKRIRK